MTNYEEMSTEELIKLYEEEKKNSIKYYIYEQSKKLNCNSAYGALANEYFVLFDETVAESVTANGRYLNLYTAKKVEQSLQKALNDTGSFLIYGDTDSCEKTTKVNINGLEKTIEEHFEDCEDVTARIIDGKKEIIFPNESFSPCFDGSEIAFKKVKAIYRHKVTKKRYRLKTSSGKEVVVTEDHSLMVMRDESLIEIKPKDFKIGDKVVTIDRK